MMAASPRIRWRCYVMPMASELLDEVPMKKLTASDLYSLEQYKTIRSDFRANIMTHKKNRMVHIGPHATLYFEDHMTMHYQIQEMLRVERIFDPDGIAQELAAYNPLIPDGSNWKATFMLEYDDVEQRKQALIALVGIEHRVWVKVNGCESVWAIADEDMERATENKTSSVHFLRFELTPEMIRLAKQDAPLALGIDHNHYRHKLDPMPKPARDSLVADLEG